MGTPARLRNAVEKPAEKDGRQIDLSLPAGLGNVTMLCFPLPENLPEAMRKLLTERNLGEDLLAKPCNASVVCIEIPEDLFNELVALGMKGPGKLGADRMGTDQQDTGLQGTEEQDWYNEGGSDSWPWKLVERPEEDVKKHFGWWNPFRPQTTSVKTLCDSWKTFLGTVDTTSNTTTTSTFETFLTSFCNTVNRSGVAALHHEVPEVEGSVRMEARRPTHPHPPHASPPPPPPPSTPASVEESRILKALRNVVA